MAHLCFVAQRLRNKLSTIIRRFEPLKNNNRSQSSKFILVIRIDLFIGLPPRVDSPTSLRAELMCEDPKSTKRHSIHQCLFVLLESAYKKVAIKMLVKLTPGHNFINILCTAFICADPKSAKKTVKLSFLFTLSGSRSVKAVWYVKHWWNWPLIFHERIFSKCRFKKCLLVFIFRHRRLHSGLKLKIIGGHHDLGSISFTCLWAAFMHADTKSVKKTDGFTVFFVLLGSTHVKAASKMLMKLTPGWIRRCRVRCSGC